MTRSEAPWPVRLMQEEAVVYTRGLTPCCKKGLCDEEDQCLWFRL